MGHSSHEDRHVFWARGSLRGASLGTLPHQAGPTLRRLASPTPPAHRSSHMMLGPCCLLRLHMHVGVKWISRGCKGCHMAGVVTLQLHAGTATSPAAASQTIIPLP